MIRKLFLSVALIALSFMGINNANAQEESIASKIIAGGGLAYATELDNIGFFAKGVYKIDPTWEAAVAYTYFLEKDYVNWSSLDMNAHYVFPKKDDMTFYALAGLNILFWSVDFDYAGYSRSLSDSDVALDLGGGMYYKLSESMTLNPELKYVLGDQNYLNLSVGLLFKF